MPPPVGRLVNKNKVDEARFDERVACAALVLSMSQKANAGSTIENVDAHNAMLSNIAKAILARGTK
jgi:hypothetical protein